MKTDPAPTVTEADHRCAAEVMTCQSGFEAEIIARRVAAAVAEERAEFAKASARVAVLTEKLLAEEEHSARLAEALVKWDVACGAKKDTERLDWLEEHSYRAAPNTPPKV